MACLHSDQISLHYSAVSHIVSLISFYDFASYLIRSLNGIQMNPDLRISGCVALWLPDPFPCNYSGACSFVRVRGDMLVYYKFKMTAKLPLVLPGYGHILTHTLADP